MIFQPWTLPPKERFVESITSDGTQYIDTGFMPNQDTRVIMDLKFPLPTENAVAFGCITDSPLCTFALFANASAYRNDYGASWQSVYTTSITDRFIADKNKNVQTLNGVANEAVYTEFSVGCGMYLFARNHSGIADCFSKITLYSCKIYDNGTLVRDYLPARDLTGELCLWDAVNKNYAHNAGTGVFT